MPESIEVETSELHAAVQEIHEDHERRVKEERETHWSRFIPLTTAFLAVFAAVGSLQASKLVNEGMMRQIKASDTWSQYQADRLKDHLYTLEVNSLVDGGAPAPAPDAPRPPDHRSVRSAASGVKHSEFAPKSPADRAADYAAQIAKETSKEDDLSAEAKTLEAESGDDIVRHERFASAVALIQVAIALSAIAALTKNRSVWYGSMLVGLIGVALFCYGYLR